MGDGGEQEFRAAKSCVDAMFPGSKVTKSRVDSPMIVTITATTKAGEEQIWSGNQRDLYKKYGHRAKPKINDGLKKFKKAIDDAAAAAAAAAKKAEEENVEEVTEESKPADADDKVKDLKQEDEPNAVDEEVTKSDDKDTKNTSE